MTEILIRYLHFIGIFFLFSSLVVEHFLLQKNMSIQQFKKLAIVDAIYGANAAIVLIAGLSLWFLAGKPASFYSSNGIFHLKLALFILIALLSITPTLFFLKNRQSNQKMITVPKNIILIVRIELLLLITLPLLASLMARGFGNN